MKRTFFYFILFFIGILFIYSCTENLAKARKKGIVMSNCIESETFGHTFADFSDVVNRYTKERWIMINDLMRNNQIARGSLKDTATDSRSIWFSLDSLKQFICTIEKYSARLKELPEKLGVRMYYAVYPETHGKYPSMHTLFMVPTFQSPDDNSAFGTDFDPRYLFNLQNDPPADIKPDFGLNSFGLDAIIARGDISTPLLILSGSSENTGNEMVANDGGLCPPCTKGCIHGKLNPQ